MKAWHEFDIMIYDSSKSYEHKIHGTFNLLNEYIKKNAISDKFLFVI